MEAGLMRRISLRDWRNAAQVAANLSDLTLTLGEVERAATFGKQSVDLADRSDQAFYQMLTRTALADALHQAGRWEESVEAFRKAEVLQTEQEPEYPWRSSLGSYRYCNLLLSRGEPEDAFSSNGLDADPEATRRFREACRKVLVRATQALRWAEQQSLIAPLNIALNHLSLGQAHRGLALTIPREEAEPDFAKAAEHLDQAVAGLRRSGQEYYLPRGLLARAALGRLRGELAAAKADLSEALEIAERGAMRLHECDAHLEWARLCRQRGDRDGLEKHVARARKLVGETGYGRREREVGWLERQLG
jgi:tetratricopeptide (TPR) repeat protein